MTVPGGDGFTDPLDHIDPLNQYNAPPGGQLTPFSSSAAQFTTYGPVQPLAEWPPTYYGPAQGPTGWPPASYDPAQALARWSPAYLTPARRYYYPVQVPSSRPCSPPMEVPVSWACPTAFPVPATYTLERWRAYGGRWVNCPAAASQVYGWGAAGPPPCGWGTAGPTAVVTAAPQPYRVASGANAIAIYYHLERADGHLEVKGGTPLDTRSLAVELNGQATGPARVLIEVFANLPGVGAVGIASFHSVPGVRGTYALDAAGMERLAREFIRFMNNSDPYISASRPIPAVTLTLRVTGDDPNPASPAITLPQVATLTPYLRNAP